MRSISREEADNHHPGYKGLGLDNVFYQTHLVLQLLPTSTISAYFDLTMNFWLNAIWATCGLPNKISLPPVTTNVVLFSGEIANKITLGHATDVVIAVAASILQRSTSSAFMRRPIQLSWINTPYRGQAHHGGSVCFILLRSPLGIIFPLSYMKPTRYWTQRGCFSWIYLRLWSG